MNFSWRFLALQDAKAPVWHLAIEKASGQGWHFSGVALNNFFWLGYIRAPEHGMLGVFTENLFDGKLPSIFSTSQSHPTPPPSQIPSLHSWLTQAFYFHIRKETGPLIKLQGAPSLCQLFKAVMPLPPAQNSKNNTVTCSINNAIFCWEWWCPKLWITFFFPFPNHAISFLWYILILNIEWKQFQLPVGWNRRNEHIWSFCTSNIRVRQLALIFMQKQICHPCRRITHISTVN